MKHKVTLAALAITALLTPGIALAGSIDPGLTEIMAATPPGQPLSCLVFLSDQADLDAITEKMDAQRATLRLRHETVVRALQAKAEATQGDLVKVLESLKAGGRVQDFHAFWIANCIRLDATRDVIEQIAARKDVRVVYFDYEIELDEPVGTPRPGGPGGMRTPEIGLIAVRAPEVWEMGFTGEGILVATLDTGVDGNHPALASRWRGVADPRYLGHPEWAWFDPVTNTLFPQSFGSHGTHTMGTVCGGAPGDEIGVAPGAQWIHAAVIDRVSIPQTVADAILSFQWMLDPDGDPSTNWDVPHVCSNSWRLVTGHGYPPCDETFWVYLDACHAAGIVILFSAGNEGPGANSIGRPPDRATDEYRTCAVGAVDANNPSWPVAGFSSRGPSYCTPDGSAAIKPDIAAPGVNVRSSVPGGGYQGGGWSGTSMASPHVNGVVALIRQACPNLTVEEVIQIIYDSAHDLGSPGEDNDYGYGMVDAYEAVLLALALCGPSPPEADDGTYETLPNTPVTITLVAADHDGEPDPPGSLTYIIDTLPEHGTLNDPGAGTIDTVPYTLVDGGNEVIFTPDFAYTGPDSFQFKANDGGIPPDGGDSNVATISILIAPIPEVVYEYMFDDRWPYWEIEGDWAWGTPLGAGGEQGNNDPTSGHTGTKVLGYNLSGDYPNDMPEHHMTTTAIDCSELVNVQLTFWRHLNVEDPAHDHAYVRVSNNGTDWVTVWENTEEVTDSMWTQRAYSITGVADLQPTVYIRWTMGTSDASGRYSGWNVDDIQIWGAEPLGPCFGIEFDPGDVNVDGQVNGQDVEAFVAILLEPNGSWSGEEWCAADADGSGEIDMEDVDDFADLLLGS